MTVAEGQLPPETKQSGNKPIGALQPGLYQDEDVLAQQAAQAALAKSGKTYQAGQAMPQEVIERVKQVSGPGVGHGMNPETLNSLMQGTLNRDQLWAGNNTQWTGYYLEEGAKFIMPLDTPFKNILPRVPGVGIDEMNWRAVTDLFGGNGPSLGNFILQQQGAPQGLTYNFFDTKNIFRTLAVGDVITEESELYGQLFEPDMRAKVASKLIPALMLGQELAYIQSAQNLWAPPQPLVTMANTGGSLNSNTLWFLVTAVNANGETLATNASSAVSGATTGTGTATLTIFRVPNATSYNVYVGTGTTQPANTAMYLQNTASTIVTNFGSATALNDPGGITPGYFTATLSTLNTSGTAYSSVVTAGNTAVAFKDTSSKTAGKPLTFDGYLALIYKYAGTGSTIGVGGATSQISSVRGTLTQSSIDKLLENGFLNARANPSKMLVSIKDARQVTNIVANGSYYRVIADSTGGTDQSNLSAGFKATKYVNPVTGRLIDVLMLPYMPQGTIAFLSTELPYPVAEINKPVLRIEYNREMWAREYPPDQGHKTQWAYSAFTNESMALQFIGGQLLLDSITLA